jgi:alkylation response protein AidB-like acyl-CoA dehydrogenase
MLFELPQAARELQALARRVADTLIAPRAAEVDRAEAYPWDNVAALREAGLLGYTIPRAYGGAGGNFLDAVIIIEEMARVCGVTGRIAVETNMGAISAVMQYGSEAQKRLAARLVLDGDKPAIRITEPTPGYRAPCRLPHRA